MSRPTSSSPGPGLFPHTRWSLVLSATRGDAAESAPALETICRTYWQPLYAYARRCGQSPHDAQDLTQEFFRHLLEKRWLDAADPDKGRLRTFLIVMLKRFMSKEWRRASAQRRGGGQALVPFDTALAESRYAADQTQPLPADETFDRQWALTLLELAVERLRVEFETQGKPGDFDALKDCLTAGRGGIDYATMAERLGLNAGAARVAVHRLRRRFREIFREEIARTLADGVDVDGEVHHLAAALARG